MESVESGEWSVELTEFGLGSVGSAKLPSITKKTSNDSIVPQVSHINDRLAGKARGECVTHFGW